MFFLKKKKKFTKSLLKDYKEININYIMNSINRIKSNKDIFEIVVKLELIKTKVKNIFFRRSKLTKKEFLKIKKNINTILSSS